MPLDRFFAKRTAQTEAARVSKEVAGLRERLAAVGYVEPPKKLSPLLWILEQLRRPEAAIMNVVREITSPQAGQTPGKFDPLGAFWRGLTLQEPTEGRDIAADLGLSREPLFRLNLGPITFSPSPAGIVGFGLEVLNPLDPLNWITFGTTKLAGKGGETAAALLEKAFGTSVMDDVFALLGPEVAEKIRGETVGELIEAVMNRISRRAATSEGIDTAWWGQRLLEAAQARGLKPGSRIMPEARKAIQLTFQTPYVNRRITSITVPGSEQLLNVLQRLGRQVVRTPLGQAAGRMFSTEFVPETTPTNVWARMLRTVSAEGIPPFMPETGPVARAEHAVEDILTGPTPPVTSAVTRITSSDVFRDILQSDSLEEVMEKTVQQAKLMKLDLEDLVSLETLKEMTPEKFKEFIFQQADLWDQEQAALVGVPPEKVSRGFKQRLLHGLQRELSDRTASGAHPLTMLPEIWYGIKHELWDETEALRLLSEYNQMYNFLEDLGVNIGEQIAKGPPPGWKRWYRKLGSEGEFTDDLRQLSPDENIEFVDVPETVQGPKLPVEWARQAKPYIEPGLKLLTPESTPEEATRFLIEKLQGKKLETVLAPQRGAEAYKEITTGLKKMLARSRIREQEFMEYLDKQVFKGVSEADRKLVMRAAIYPEIYAQLPNELKAVTDAFKNWREEIVKRYTELGVTFTPLEVYVPFVITGKPLTKDEAAMLRGIFKTGVRELQQEAKQKLLEQVPRLKATEADKALRDFLTSLLTPSLGAEKAKQLIEKADLTSLKEQVNALMQDIFGEGVSVVEPGDLINFISQLDPYLKHRTTRAIDPEKVNKVLGREWLTEDAAVAMARRGVKAIRGQEAAAFLQGMLQKYGLKVSDLQKLGALPPGYVLVKPVHRSSGAIVLEGVEEMAGKALALPQEFVKAYNDYVDLLFNTEAKTAFGKFYDAVTRVYKTMAYMWSPGHIPRDLGSNIYNLWLMDVRDPRRYIQAFEILRNPNLELFFPVWKGTGKELLKQLRELDLLDTGGIMAEFLQVGQDWTFKIGGKYTEAMRKATRWVDNYARLVGVIDRMSKGEMMERAVETTKKYLFDYFDLTPFEKRWMKRIVPFYTWMRKNIPLQVKTLLQKPGKLATTRKWLEGLGEIPEEGEAPQFIREEAGIRLPSPGGGFYIVPNLSYGDLANLPLSWESMRSLLGGLNPLIRAPIELLTNVSLFSGQPIERYEGEQQNLPLAELLARLGVNLPTVRARGLGYLLEQIPPLRNLSVLANPEHPRRSARALSLIGGPQVYPVDWATQAAAYEIRDQLRALIRALQDRNIEVPTLEELSQQSTRTLIGRLRRRR